VRAGKVRYAGTSNYASWQICSLLYLAERNGCCSVPLAQPMHNLLARGIEQEFLPMCKEMGVATVIYNPLAGGLLTAKHRIETPLPGTRFDENKNYQDRYWHSANFEAIRSLTGIAERAGRSLISVSLNWLLHHTPIDCVILGASRVQHLKENVKVLDDGPMEGNVVEACDAVWRKLRGVTPQYNR
jgi:aryl-alcohol dehydrogenase-like predicted oxidoreductase